MSAIIQTKRTQTKRFARSRVLTASAVVAALTLLAVAGTEVLADDTPAVRSCVVAIHLTSIVSVRTLDDDGSGDPDAPGEYSIRALSSAAVGPFDLRTGDSSSFAPGLHLDTVDTGWLVPGDAATTVAPVAFGILASEDDSNPVGEDDHDDSSAPLLVREHITCPGGTTRLSRTIDVVHETGEGRRKRSDRLRLGIELTVID